MGRHQNSALLKLIEREAFEVFLTGDIMSAINWPWSGRMFT
jgi:hypothetical protein